MNRPVMPDPIELGAGASPDRLLLLRSDGTVAWESPEGWAGGARLESFLHHSRRRQLDEAIHMVAAGRGGRKSFTSDVVGADGEWRSASVEVSAAPAEWPGLLVVMIRVDAEAEVVERASWVPPGGVERGGVERGGVERGGVERGGRGAAGGHGPPRDSLTELPSRDAVLDRFKPGEDNAGRESLGVMYIDVDNFKRVNDRLGHSGGDQVLLAVADRLRTAVRPGDLVSRFGGDEFVVVAGGVEDPTVASVIAERIRAAMARPIRVDGRRVTATLSVGVAVGDSTLGTALLDQADTALYRAKEHGRDRVEMYQAGDRIRGSRQVRAEAVLSEALDGGSLAVAYQPIVDLASGATAMMRVSLWTRSGDDQSIVGEERRGEGGLERPDALLRLAEESGLIVSLGAGVLDEACAAGSSWRTDGQGTPAVGLVWKMTSRQLEEPRAAEQVLATLAAHQMPPGWLTVEISGASLHQAGPATRRTVDQLRTGGVRLMLAGFGGGTGGIAELGEFAVDAVTLDPAFVEDLDADPSQTRMVTALLAFGRLLDIDVAASGVATEAQATMLKALGCRWASGPYFGTPASGDVGAGAAGGAGGAGAPGAAAGAAGGAGGAGAPGAAAGVVGGAGGNDGATAGGNDGAAGGVAKLRRLR